MQKFIYLLLPIFVTFSLLGGETITPYKFTDSEIRQAKETGFNAYAIPESCRFILPSDLPDLPPIVFYLSKPTSATPYPIVILCGGSMNKESVYSIIHVHRYFLQECLDLNLGTVTVELRGVDGTQIDDNWINYYTRSQRLADHKTVIEHLKKNPPIGWNGKFVLIGVSEGGPLVTSLTEEYATDLLATINWSGAGDFSWQDELWDFMQNSKKNFPWFVKARLKLPHWLPWDIDYPANRSEYYQRINEILNEPLSTDKYFMGMTYKYHADALTYPAIQYTKITTPFLVVSGAQDSFIESSDAFVQKAQTAGVNITYMRIPDMDHYIRRRPEIIAQSFDWLKKALNKNL